MLATDVSRAQEDDTLAADSIRVDLEQVRRDTNATKAYVWRLIASIQQASRSSAGNTNILVMIHKSDEVATFDLPIYGFCGVIVPSAAHREAVAHPRARPPPDGI